MRAANLALRLLVVSLLLPAISSAQPNPLRRVLVFYEMGLSSPTVGLVDQELRDALANAPYQIELYHEYLETILFPDPVVQQEFREWYIRKYRDRRPDLIIALGPSPLKFLVESQEKFFVDIPIVFGGAAELEADNPILDRHFTGVWERFEPEKTLEGALRLQPDTHHVVVVGGMSPFDRRLEALYKERLHSYENKLDFTYLTDLDMTSLLEQLKHLPPRTVVLYTHFGLDAKGTPYVGLSEAGPLISAAAKAPVFNPSDLALGHGEVGGYLHSVPAEARIVGEIAARILNGERPQDIPIVTAANTYTFDWQAMQHWGLKERNLPPGSIVLNREPTFWEAYRRYVVSGTLLLLAQATIIVALLWQWTRRKKTQEALALVNERLQLAMEAAKATSWHMDLKTGLTTWSGCWQSMFGGSANTYSAQIMDLSHQVHSEDRQRVSEALNHAREQREPFAVEFRSTGSDGVTRWFSARGKFDYQSNGDALHMLGMALDITERKLTEQALQKSEEKFSKAFHESPLALTITGVNDNRYIEVNETFERATGWHRDEVIGRTPGDLRLWVDPQGRARLISQLLADGNVRNLEVTFRTKDGQARAGLGCAELIEVNGEQCALSVVLDITDHKRAEEARRISEQRFRQFFETIPEYGYMISPGGEILDINPAACRALGYSKEELIGQQVSVLYAPESHSKIAALNQEWTQTGSLQNEEMEVLTKAGKRRTVLLNKGAVKDAQGNILPSASVLVDITDYKEVQQKLRDSQNRLESIVTSAMDAIIATDSEQRIVVFNAAAEAMFGCPAPEAFLSSIERFIPKGFRWVHQEHVRRFGTTGVGNRALGTVSSLWGLRANGEEFPMEMSISQVEADGKKFVVTIIRDVTERRQAEEAVRESEQRFRLVANMAPVMIWMCDTDKLCTYCNQPWLEFTGRSLEAELGNGWTEGIHADDSERCLNTFTKAFDRREPFHMEYRYRHHGGGYRWLHDMGVPRYNTDGSFAGYIGSSIDVTERKLAEDALSTVSRRLIEAHEEERTWLARELHDDVNQRLALLAVTLDVVKRGIPPAATEARRSISEITKQLRELGNDVQALSHRLHSSKLEYLGLVSAANGFCRELSERQGMQIDFHCEEVPTTLPKEISLCLYRVLQEALQNAVKHSGSRHFQVSLTCTLDKIHLTVRDSGVGFSREEEVMGRGLGIVSMRERLKLVDGELSIDSQVQKGTEVRATIPLISKAAAVGKT
jgi:PAS domain S-box-containing protein